jgi:hypothetical protein
MAAVALPVALLLGMLVELVAGLVSRPLGGDRAWWRGVSGVVPDMLRLVRDRSGRERVSVVEAGGAAASFLGAGIAAAGALGLGPGGLILLYLALAVASAGAMVVGWERVGRQRRLATALAEPAFAIGLGALFLRYGALDLDAVRGTQQVLGTGLLLGPGLAVVGLVAAAKAVAWSAALRVSALPEVKKGEMPGAGPAVLLRLCRWSLAGATSILAGVLLAGGGLEPFTADGLLPLGAGAAGFAVALGVAGGILRRLPDRWVLAVPALALGVGAAGAALVVLS